MKPILININEMSDSREVYDSKPNIFFTLFIYLILGILIIAFLWMYFGHIDVVVKSEGMIRPNNPVSTVVNTFGGTLEAVNIVDGSCVQEGDILYSIEHNNLLTENDYYNNQLIDTVKTLSLLDKYTESIKAGVNYFENNPEEEEYYLKFIGYYYNLELQGEKNYLLEDQNNQYGSIAKYKNNELSTTITNINTYTDKKNELEANIDKLNTQIDSAVVKATRSGVVNSSVELVEGDILSNGIEVLTIIPEEDSQYKVSIYVSNANIGKLSDGMAVKFNVYALPKSEYGYLTGTITQISKDLKVDSNNTSGYYLVETNLDAKTLYDVKGEKANLKAGMACQAQMITESKRILTYVLEKINLWRE